MRIRRRLVLYAIGVTTAGMTLFSVLLIALAARGVVDDQDRTLAALATREAAVVGATDPATLAGRSPLDVADLAVSVDPFVVVVRDDGSPLYATAALDGQPPHIPAAVLVEAISLGVSTATIRPNATVELRVHAIRYSSGTNAGIVVAGQSTRFTENQVAGLRAFLLLAAFITIVAVTLVSWLVTGRALRPLRALAATAESIGTTADLTTRLPPVRSGDEVGILTSSFNRMLDRLAEAQARLGEALEAQRRFVADASHELRTPLATIRTNAGFLVEHPGAEPADRTEATEDLLAEADRMARLVDELVTLARSDAGAPIERRPVDLAAIGAEVARSARRGEREVRVEATGAVVVSGDRDALLRLAWILVDNALRHGAGPVAVRVLGRDGRAELTVADEGPGVPAGDEERIFDRFHRADAARSGGGAGLGLAIARAIAEAHGGRIGATNRPTGGLEIRVELPLA